ncbi:hypothetical protein pb186bvf_012735 [Paramecium bursaria]
MQQNKDPNYKRLRVSIWNFNNPDKKVQDDFITLTEDIRQKTMIQFHAFLNESYVRSDKQLILFQGREIKVDQQTVAQVFDLEQVTIRVQGVSYQINPMKLPLHVFEEKQVASLSEQNRQFYQNRMNEVQMQRVKWLQLIQEKQNLKKLQPKLCFVIDTTKSMYNYRQTIMQIVDQIRYNQNNPDFSFVLYKDVNQKKGGKYDGLNFSNRQQQIKQFIENTCYEGGDDEPDDLNGALEQALSYSWVTEKQPKEINQQIIVITDSPCHGQQYHNLFDDYPNKDLMQVIEQIKEYKIRLTIYTFNGSTDLMIKQIRQHFSMHSDYFRHIDANKMYEQTEIDLQITQTQSTVLRPLQSGLFSSKILEQLYQKLIQENEIAKINSLKLDLMVGIKQNYYLRYNTTEELLKAYEQRQEILNVSQDQQIQMNVSTMFINNGNDKIYLIKSNHSEFENRIFYTKTNQFRLTLEEALPILSVQSISNKLLQEFKNKQPKVKKYPIPEVNFSELILIKLQNTQQYIICEEFYSYPYIEFNTYRQDQITLRTGDLSHVNQFLQHFTHESLGLCDKFKTMVINLVGFSSEQKTILTDPKLLTLKYNMDEINHHEELFEDLNLERYYSIFQ